MRFIILITACLVIGFTGLWSVPGSPFLLDGRTQADISNMYPTYVTPAGFTFSIWTLIYAVWIFAGLHFARMTPHGFFSRHFPRISRHFEPSSNKDFECYFPLIMATSLIWLIPWSYNMIGLSVFVITGLLGLLIFLFLKTRTADRIIRSTVELTLGWINVATIANITVWFVSIGFTGFGINLIYWAIGILAIGTGLTLFLQFRYHTRIISFVFLWALFGIFIAQSDPLQRSFIIFYATMITGSIIASWVQQKVNHR